MLSGPGLARVFLAALPGDGDGAADSAADSAADVGDLAAALGGLVERGHAGWPELRVDAEAFVRHVATRCAGALSPSGLAQVHASDLYLACACTRGDAAALAAFERAYRETIRGAALRVLPPPAVDDAVQLTLERLLVAAAGEAPRLAQYSGRAELAGFVRVVATRVALSARRRAHPDAGDDGTLAALDDGTDDPELRYLKTLYRAQFRAAFAAALTGLSPHDRSLLRYQVVEGLSVDQLAAIYRRPRSTMGRHLLEARGRLVDETRAQLRRALQVTESVLDSVLRLVQSSVDVSVRRLLVEADEAARP